MKGFNYAERNFWRVYRNGSIIYTVIFDDAFRIGDLIMGQLEREFEEYKALHKFAILKCKIMQYYRDLEENQVLVPDFQRSHETPEALADRDLRCLVLRKDNLQEFNRLYELAYQEIAEVLD